MTDLNKILHYGAYMIKTVYKMKRFNAYEDFEAPQVSIFNEV